MAIKYFCDRCSKEVRSSGDLENIQLAGRRNDVYAADSLFTKDICSTCSDQVKRFLNRPGTRVIDE